MASGQERALRRRIKTVQSTKKITRAMELIAASRIVKAQQRVAAARPYADQITEVMRNLSSGGSGLDHPLLTQRDPVSNVGFIVISADRGLAGAYNSAVIRAAERAIQAVRAEGKGYSLTLAGRKAEGYFRYKRYDIDEAFTGFSEQPSYEDARRLAEGPMRRYEEGEVDRVKLVFTRFLSVGTQKVTTTRLLPLEKAALEELPRMAATAAVAPRPTTSSSPSPARSSSGSCPGTSRAGCSPPCSTPRPASRPPGSGP